MVGFTQGQGWDLSSMKPPYAPPPTMPSNPVTMAPPSRPMASSQSGGYSAFQKLLTDAQGQIKANQSNKSEPTDMFEGMSDLQRFLLETGLGMMVAGGKPGATFLGAAGEGAMGAANNTEMRTEKKRKRQDELSKQKIDELMQLVGLGKTSLDADMDMKRFMLSQQQANKPDYSTIETDSGMMRFNKDTGSLEPLMFDGKPLRAARASKSTEELAAELMKGYDPVVSGETPEDYLRSRIGAITSMRGGGTPSAMPSEEDINFMAKKYNMTPEEVIANLKKEGKI
jgi:hypothetical protein